MSLIQEKIIEVYKKFDAFKATYWMKGIWQTALVAVTGILIGAMVMVAFAIDLVIDCATILQTFLMSRLFRILLAFSYFYSQNNYFGWNPKPMSDTELITDGIWVLLVMLAVWPEHKPATVTINNKED